MLFRFVCLFVYFDGTIRRIKNVGSPTNNDFESKLSVYNSNTTLSAQHWTCIGERRERKERKNMKLFFSFRFGIMCCGREYANHANKSFHIFQCDSFSFLFFIGLFSISPFLCTTSGSHWWRMQHLVTPIYEMKIGTPSDGMEKMSDNRIMEK